MMKTKKGKMSVHKRKAMKRKNGQARQAFFSHVDWKRRMDESMRGIIRGGF